MTVHEPATPTADEVAAGHAAYTRRLLGWYDCLVLGISCRFVWRCEARYLLELYNRHISTNHLDVGVGTGYFLDRCCFPRARPHVVLGDPNADCLALAARRIARYDPQTIRVNVLEPFEWPGNRFESIGLNLVLHCVPGEFPAKGRAFTLLAGVLDAAGVLFGSTILADGVPHTFVSRRLMAQYNRLRIFANARDSLAGLRTALAGAFDDVEISTRGSVALFVARLPKAR